MSSSWPRPARSLKQYCNQSLCRKSAGTTSVAEFVPTGKDKPPPCSCKALMIRPHPSDFTSSCTSAVMNGSVSRWGGDLVEDDVPGFAGPGDFVNVEDLVILFIIETEEAPQS